MASPTIVQHKSNTALTATTVTATFSSAVTAGHMILVFVGAAQSNTINTPTMTGETFTVWTGAPNAGSATHGQTGVWARNSATGGQSAVTVTVANNDDIHLHIMEISGQAASPRDAQGNTESTTLSVSTSATTATANDLDVAFFFDFSNNQTFTAGSGYSQVEQTNDATNGDAAFSESQAVSSTGVQTATASGNAGDTVEQSIVAVAGTASASVVLDHDGSIIQLPSLIEINLSLWQ